VTLRQGSGSDRDCARRVAERADLCSTSDGADGAKPVQRALDGIESRTTLVIAHGCRR
jgi:hypothetical protein